jgi:hypothetical protein
MADDTLRITIDVAPIYADEAFQLFGKRGIPMGIARLMPEAAQASAQRETIAAESKPKGGGPLCVLVCRWCKVDSFFEFIRPAYDRVMGGSGSSTGDITIEEVGGTEAFCRHAICVICDIESRAELDHNGQAARIFNEKIRAPYMEYLRNV